MTIRYKLVNGSIPEGCRIISDRGIMKITGVAPLDPDFNPPVINTPAGSLGVLNELEPATIDLDISVAEGKEFVGATILDGLLPWGLSIVGSRISGTLAELMVKDPVSFLPEDAPKWSTRDGQLAVLAEFQDYSTVLEVDKQSNFTISKGFLPWGMALLPDGTITGRTGEAGGEPEPAGPGPVWNTARGRLATFNEFDTVGSISVSASARTGTDIHYTIPKGALPWGLNLDIVTGQISGKVEELRNGGENDNPIAAIRPSLASKSFSGVVGSAFSMDVSPTIPEGRTLMSVDVVSGEMPFGLTLAGSTISGTPLYPGSHTFSLVVTDSEHIKSTPISFTFEVTA